MTNPQDNDKNESPETPVEKKKEFLAELEEETKIDLATIKPSDGPPATPERAAEIAGMPDFGFLEFFEITGVEQGRFGTFVVNEAGVRPSVDRSQPEWTAQQRIDIRNNTEGITLEFRCTPDVFVDWHERTRSANGASDFSVAPGFFKALSRRERTSLVQGDIAVPSDAIIAAFAVEEDSTRNYEWWDMRLRSAKKYEGLLAARAQKGAAAHKSMWYPRLVGTWLCENEHMRRGPVARALETSFPDADLEWL